jgi:hypothetical protein
MRTAKYSLNGQPRQRLTGALKVLPIPSSYIAEIDMMIYVDDNLVESQTVSSLDRGTPIPFEVPLNGASNVTLAVRCNSSAGSGAIATDNRGIFVDAALS